MDKQRYKPEEIILKLREVEIGQGKGLVIATACRNAGITDVTYYRHNGKFRNELLNGDIFATLQEAQILIERWREHYNTVRPHSSLGYRPPAPETTAPRRLNQPPLQHKSWYN